ncbi:Uncharacterised protein [Candidatus Anstonella stagnisolia]|nr:Uncharacterised protein [Candidatus Anstonella stagnisolia]
MPKPTFNVKENRAAAFAEFLQNKFGKPAAEVSKAEILTLVKTDFSNPLWRKTSFGSAASLYVWYKRFEGGVLFSIFNDLGYAQFLGIKKEDMKNEVYVTSAEPSQYADLEARRKLFLSLYEKVHGKGAALTKDGLLLIGKTDFQRHKVEGGNLYGFFIYYSSIGKGRYYDILLDLGYAQQFGITEKDLEEAAKKRAKPSVYSKIEYRTALFNEAIGKLSGADPHSLTKEQLVALAKRTQELWALKGLKSGSINGLYYWYKKQFKKTYPYFAMLKDLGHADRLGISEAEIKKAVSENMGASISKAKAVKKRVVIKPVQRISEGRRANLALPRSLSAVYGAEGGKIEIIMSTVREVREGFGKGGGSFTNPSLILQAITRQFPGTQAISPKGAFWHLSRAPVGFVCAIPSKPLLDEIFLGGLRGLGYAILDENIRYSTGDASVDAILGRWSATRVQRVEELRNATPIMFKNDFHPDKEALHALGQYSRRIKSAQFTHEVEAIQAEAQNWLREIGKQGIVDTERMEYVTKRYSEVLLGMVQSRTNELLAQQAQSLAPGKMHRNGMFSGTLAFILNLISFVLPAPKQVQQEAAGESSSQGAPTTASQPPVLGAGEHSSKLSVLLAARKRVFRHGMDRLRKASELRVENARARERLSH